MTLETVRSPSQYVEDTLRVTGVSDAFLLELETNECIASASNRDRKPEETVAWAGFAMAAVSHALTQLAARGDVREIELGTTTSTVCLYRLGLHRNIVLCAVLEAPHHHSQSSRRAICDVAGIRHGPPV